MDNYTKKELIDLHNRINDIDGRLTKMGRYHIKNDTMVNKRWWSLCQQAQRDRASLVELVSKMPAVKKHRAIQAWRDRMNELL